MKELSKIRNKASSPVLAVKQIFMLNKRVKLITSLLFLIVSCFWAAPGHGIGDEALYKKYTDPNGRFSFEYPATMNVQSTNADEVKVTHPGASFRITVFVEQRQGKSKLTAADLLAWSKKRLQEEMKNVSVLGEGKLPSLEGSQGYVAVSFTDKKGMQLVQMVEYYVAEDRFLQMTISDRPEGFKNLQTVIQKVHQSLKILNPKLK